MHNKNCFDFLRFLFAFTILLSHLFELSQSKELSFLDSFTNSSIAVQGFFVISGFLVAKSYTNTPSLKQYFIKRIKRIVPAYIFIILFSVIVLSIFSTFTISEYFSNINTYKYIGWNSIFLNFMHPCLPGLFENNLMCAVNGSLWTLKVEEGFYVVLPIIFYFIKKTRQYILILILLYILSILYYVYFQHITNKPLLAKQLPGYISYFSTGILLFLKFDFFYKYRYIFLTIGFVGFLAVKSYSLPFLYPFIFGILVIAASYTLSFLNNFGKYGDFTYGIYISHFPIIQVFKQYNLFEKYNPYLIGFLVILLSLTFAFFSWNFIEKKFLDRYKLVQIQ